MLRAKGHFREKSSSGFRCIAAKIKLNALFFQATFGPLTIISELKGKYLISQINLRGPSRQAAA
jgi:hypothetical protein